MFKELFTESDKRLVFTITDSEYSKDHLERMIDNMKLSYPIEQDNPYTWVSVNPLGLAHQKILKKEIESQLDYNLKKDKAYKFTER